MRQLSLLEDSAALAGVMPALRAAMNRTAGDPGGEGRKLLTDRINAVARQAGIKLTGGNAKGISKDLLDKWLSASDTTHPPGINAVLAFCAATGDHAPLRIMLRAVGLDIMTEEDRRYRDIGKAEMELAAARKRKKLAREHLCDWTYPSP